MQIAVEVKGLTGLVKDFTSASPAIRRELNQAINSAGVTIQRQAKIEAPVRTGNLRNQIRYKNTMNGQGVVGSYAQYSIYVHEGTRHQRANPYMTRAVDLTSPQLNVIFTKATKNISSLLVRGG